MKFLVVISFAACLSALHGFRVEEEKFDFSEGRWLEPSTSLDDDFVDYTELASMPEHLKREAIKRFEQEEDEDEDEDEVYEDIHGEDEFQDPLFVSIPLPRISVPLPRVSVPLPRVSISVPRISVPRISIPRISVPRISIPRISVPRIYIPLPRINLKLPQVNLPSINLGPPPNPLAIVSGLFNTVKQVVSTVAGKVGYIYWNTIGKHLGPLVQSTFSFLNCVFPHLSTFVGCVAKAIESTASCITGSGDCHIYFGGRESDCLRFVTDQKFEKLDAPFIFKKGHIKANVGFGLSSYLNTGKIKIAFYGDLSVKTNVILKLKPTRKRSGAFEVQDRIPLTARPAYIFQKLIIIWVKEIPVPFMLEVLAQPCARVKVNAKTSAPFVGKIVMREFAKISLEGIGIEYEPFKGLPRLFSRQTNNLDTFKTVKLVDVRGNSDVRATFQIGVEFTFKVNGIALKAFPFLQMKMNGLTEKKPNCVKGSYLFSASSAMLVLPDVKALTSVADNFMNVCGGLVHGACNNPLANSAKCIGIPGIKDVCDKTNNGCRKISEQLAKIPNPIQKNPTMAVFNLGKGRQRAYLVNGGNTCKK